MSTMFKKCVNFWKMLTSTNVRIYTDLNQHWSSLQFKTLIYRSIGFQKASVFLVGPSIAFCQFSGICDSVNKSFIAKFVWNDDFFNLARSLWSFITGVAAHKGISDVVIIKEVKKHKLA